LPVVGTNFVRRTDDFDRGDQTAAAATVVDPNFILVAVSQIRLDGQRRLGRRPDGRGNSACFTFRRYRTRRLLIERRHVDFDLAP
jgi:hypothetical protein